MLPPLGDLHRIECWLLHHGLRLKVILRPALPRHGLLYERSALLASATEECLARKRPRKSAERTPHSRRSGNLKWCSREDSHLEPPPSQSGVQDSYTSGAIRRASLHSACSWPAAATCRSVATPTQISQPLEITSDERVFFRARPSLDLRLSTTRTCKVSVKFDEQHFERWIECSRATRYSLGVIDKACFCIV